MHTVVELTKDPHGYSISNPQWHLSVSKAGGNEVLCTGETYGYGDGEAVFKEKEVTKGGISCPDCIDKIKFFKQIKL